MLRTLDAIAHNSEAWDLVATGLLKWLNCGQMNAVGYFDRGRDSPAPKLTTFQGKQYLIINYNSLIPLCDIFKDAGNFNLSVFYTFKKIRVYK
jgi:hypothetical protein